MKRKSILFTVVIFLGTSMSCRDIMDLEPLDRVSSDVILSSEDGIRAFLANLYYRLPTEEFNYTWGGPHSGYGLWHGLLSDVMADNAAHSEFNESPEFRRSLYSYWSDGYKVNRDINLLLRAVQSSTFLEEETKNELISEAHFLRAFNYFTLAKWYGGIPVISSYQDYDPDIESLKVPRSTEKDTYDFILSDCDEAVKYLPPSRSGNDERRVTKWVAYALKSRVALHAASIAKYGSKAPLSGEAVSKGLVGIDASAANDYYEQCILASKEIMEGGVHRLYKPNPASAEEAANNYMALFQNPSLAPEEAIFTFGYTRPFTDGHTMDLWCNPNQTADGSSFPGRVNPSLELVDLYESYTTPGQSAPIVTTADGDVSDYNGYNAARTYLKFDTPYDIFKDKDARLWATVILPGTEWKGVTINIQAGFIKPDATPVIEAEKATVEVNGVTYHTFGADSWKDYSGFDPQHIAEMTRTGFSFKKFLSPTTVSGNANTGASTNDWIEMRYAEVLLNYAEAVIESGYTGGNAQEIAKNELNAIRRRAGHTVDIPLSLENVLRERRVELAFENKRWWDLIRRRDLHEVFNNYIHTALCPVLDLTGGQPKYIFVRKYIARGVALTVPSRYYYTAIPGIGSNDLIQNPQY
ncbi:RagB/SusD family nutrient uptake outer membrane protein [Parapedobacter soli]|uniref:RagB/SusD family nutrient uptake outer membrane protein n=1 Tax=Parapedobacter soli TaxID=416955 RepID=UPI0021C984A7|nr:RagB/SusD family nutrient uptake outer membrane protein [Parapedobacter soli]